MSIVGIAVLLSALSPAYGDQVPSDSPKLGGGQSSGTINYVGTALPKAHSKCERNLTFTLGSGDDPEAGWQSDAFVLNAPGTQYAGPVRLTGGGGSDLALNCENYSSGAGVLTLELSGYNPLTGATLACHDDAGDPSLSRPITGRYIRIYTELTAVVGGRCLVNGTPTGPVSFVVVALAVPRDLAGGEGITRAVRSMGTTGVLVRPSA